MHSDPPRDLEQPGDGLQFDRVELEPADASQEAPPDSVGAGMQCALSGEAIEGVYYEVNGRVLSEDSYRRVEAERNRGNGLSRFLRGSMFGVVAGALGALIYYFFLDIVGLEWAVISIVVGYMVGYAVSVGSRNRGGLPYQLVAVILTYLSIVAAYVPLVARELRQVEGVAEGSAVTESAAAEPAGLFAEEEDLGEEPDEATADAFEAPREEAPAPEVPQAPGEGEFDPALQEQDAAVEEVVFYFAVVVVSFLAPFLGGWGSLLSVLIIGFGLYQAWKMNHKQAFEVAGPFQVGQAQPSYEV